MAHMVSRSFLSSWDFADCGVEVCRKNWDTQVSHAVCFIIHSLSLKKCDSDIWVRCASFMFSSLKSTTVRGEFLS
ncbi:unnamed protein product [Moneuplotes crassus]|uniref:Uncharacterized protein n=1 Tax=Euplotes crassus TaxID=5936 RepID=A0AAD2D8K3_EUPCR|nr:unnamed protein product [Moneuplotes crassus]